MTKRFQIPDNLQDYVGTKYDKLIPSEEMDSILMVIDPKEKRRRLNNKRAILSEILQKLSKVINGEPIYRAIRVKKIKETQEDLIELGKYGNSWTSELGLADTGYNYGTKTSGYYDKTPESDLDWENKQGTIIMEGIVTKPDSINFKQTIDLYFQFGEEESEINMHDDWGIKLKKICKGSTTGKARKQFVENKCVKIAEKETKLF